MFLLSRKLLGFAGEDSEPLLQPKDIGIITPYARQAGIHLQHGWRRCYGWLRMEFGNTSHCNAWTMAFAFRVSKVSAWTLDIALTCVWVPAFLRCYRLLSESFSWCALLHLFFDLCTIFACFPGYFNQFLAVWSHILRTCFNKTLLTVMRAPGVLFSLLLRTFESSFRKVQLLQQQLSTLSPYLKKLTAEDI